jgi:hypothetical protein
LESNFRWIEDIFQAKCESILRTRTVRNHQAITDYLSVWQVRSWLLDHPPTDFEAPLFPVPPEPFTPINMNPTNPINMNPTKYFSFLGAFTRVVREDSNEPDAKAPQKSGRRQRKKLSEEEIKAKKAHAMLLKDFERNLVFAPVENF